MRSLWSAALALLLSACLSATPAPPVRAPSSPAVPSVGWVIAAPAAGASHYATRATPDPVRGGADSERLAAALTVASRSRGVEIQGDGRLAALGEWVAGLVDDKGTPPPQSVFDFGARHLGIAEDAPIVMTLAGGTVQEREKYMTQALSTMPANLVYNRFGVATVMRGSLPVSVAVVGSSLLELEPMPRAIPAGRAVTVRGQLDPRFEKHEVVVTAPDGRVMEAGKASGRAFQVALPISGPGVWRVEILGASAWGLSVLANFPLYVGVEPPTSVSLTKDPAPALPETTSEAVSTRLLELMNQSRKEAGLPALLPSPELAQVAAAHSRDMADNGFFGHVSPTTGDPSARVRAAGMRFPIVAENVGVGRSSSDVHRALLDSPGHRANILNPKLTHVGVGVVLKTREERVDVYATQLFARVARPIDLSRAPADMLGLINAQRAQHGATALAREPVLDAAAARGAALFLHDAAITKERLLDIVVADMEQQARKGGEPWRRIGGAESFLVMAPSLEDANAFKAAFDPDARYIGVGIAQGKKPDQPDNMIAVLLIVAWPK